MEKYEVTPATGPYPADAVAAALERISSQGLWLLLSLDRYGWRAEYDAIRVMVSARIERYEHFAEHGPLIAAGHVFALVDKVWRLVYGMRALRAGREFLNKTDGYLAGGYKQDRKLKQLAEITADEWRELLDPPSEEAIREHLGAGGAPDDEVAARVEYAAALPTLIATNMRELQTFFEQEEATTGPRAKAFSLRELDSRHRHGAPVVYHDCSPTETEWIAVYEPREGDHRGDTVGVVMLPPDERGAAFISLFKHDDEMRQGLLNTSETLAGLVRRLARAQLLALAPGLVDDPLAAVADYVP
jgi:hypothetical protein